jgi:hypothetical protein
MNIRVRQHRVSIKIPLRQLEHVFGISIDVSLVPNPKYNIITTIEAISLNNSVFLLGSFST